MLSNNDINIIKECFDTELLVKKAVKKNIIIVICGPTGVGKSAAGFAIASLFKTDIISADSMQVYKGMNIGTDKIDSSIYGIRQFMIDIFEPSHRLTVMEYGKLCTEIIKKDFFYNKKIPILVGGSGLYIKSITGNLDFIPVENNNLREKILNNIENKGSCKYYLKLKKIDKDYADKISQNDKRRIARALEVYYLTKKPFSDFQKSWGKNLNSNIILIGLNMDRNVLYKTVEKRIDEMFSRGLVNEVEILIKNGFKECLSLKQAVGYKEVIKYLDGMITEEECRNEIKKNTRNLVKKQLTWFRNDNRINWIRVDNYDNMIDLIKDVLIIIEAGVNK